MSNEPDIRKKRSAVLSVLLAAVAATACTVFLVLLTGGFFLYVVAVGLVLVGFAGLHYIVWGRMLTRLLKDEIEEARRLDEAYDEPRPPRSSTAYRQR